MLPASEPPDGLSQPQHNPRRLPGPRPNSPETAPRFRALDAQGWALCRYGETRKWFQSADRISPGQTPNPQAPKTAFGAAIGTNGGENCAFAIGPHMMRTAQTSRHHEDSPQRGGSGSGGKTIQRRVPSLIVRQRAIWWAILEVIEVSRSSRLQSDWAT
jgi:hypothetical protein